MTLSDRLKLQRALKKVEYFQRQIADAEDRYNERHQEIVERFNNQCEALKLKHKNHLLYLTNMKKYLESQITLLENKIR